MRGRVCARSKRRDVCVLRAPIEVRSSSEVRVLVLRCHVVELGSGGGRVLNGLSCFGGEISVFFCEFRFSVG